MRRVRGEGRYGIRRGYCRMLCGDDGRIKPDRMVLRWLAPHGVRDPEVAQQLLIDVAEVISREGAAKVTPGKSTPRSGRRHEVTTSDDVAGIVGWVPTRRCGAGQLGLLSPVVEQLLLFGDGDVRISRIVGTRWQRLGRRPRIGRFRRARGNHMHHLVSASVASGLRGSLEGRFA
ncbi:hypothetical protein [Blastococcus sp. SYSU DS0973]